MARDSRTTPEAHSPRLTVSLRVLLALTSMDSFSDSELFDESAPSVLRSEVDEPPNRLTVSADSAAPRLLNGGASRVAAYAAIALALLVAVVPMFHAGRSSRELHTPHAGTHRHRARSRRAHSRLAVVRRRRVVAPVVIAPAADAPRVVVEPPSSGPVRPSGGEDVGIGRPTPAPSVGNTEQFGYLGK